MKISRSKTLTFWLSVPLIAASTEFSLADPLDGAVEIWIRAFIPNPANAGRAADYIVIRPGVPGQSIVRILPTSRLPDRVTPACFVTDNRGFSAESGTTARLDTRFTISPFADGGKITPPARRTTANVTVEVNCSTGVQTAAAPGKVVRDSIGHPASADGVIQVIGQVSGKNELAASGFAPTIDYSFDLRWQPSMKQLKASVSYGSFPALEVYARMKGQQWRPVLRHSPTGSPWNLAGDAFGINFERDEQSVQLN